MCTCVCVYVCVLPWRYARQTIPAKCRLLVRVHAHTSRTRHVRGTQTTRQAAFRHHRWRFTNSSGFHWSTTDRYTVGYSPLIRLCLRAIMTDTRSARNFPSPAMENFGKSRACPPAPICLESNFSPLMTDASAMFRREIARLIEKIMEREFLMELLMRDVLVEWITPFPAPFCYFRAIGHRWSACNMKLKIFVPLKNFFERFQIICRANPSSH